MQDEWYEFTVRDRERELVDERRFEDEEIHFGLRPPNRHPISLRSDFETEMLLTRHMNAGLSLIERAFEPRLNCECPHDDVDPDCPRHGWPAADGDLVPILRASIEYVRAKKEKEVA